MTETTADREPIDPVTGEIGPKPKRTRQAAALPPQEPPAEPTKLEWSMEAEAEAEARYRAAGDEGWSLDEELKRIDGKRRADGSRPPQEELALTHWWAWCKEYEVAGRMAARADLDYDRRLGREVFKLRAHGERSAEVAATTAIAYVDQVWMAKLARDLAKARVDAADKNMKRLSAYLDQLRTRAADRRAMEQHSNWTGGRT